MHLGEMLVLHTYGRPPNLDAEPLMKAEPGLSITWAVTVSQTSQEIPMRALPCPTLLCLPAAGAMGLISARVSARVSGHGLHRQATNCTWRLGRAAFGAHFRLPAHMQSRTASKKELTAL